MPIEDVVAEHKRATSSAYEILADQKRLRNALRLGLLCILEMDAIARAIAEQLLKARQVVGRGDEQNIANPRQHKRRERIVNHRLVVDREQAFRDAMGDG